jgi:CheY-like chemotaxis protein
MSPATETRAAGPRVHVLLAEDDAGDVLMVREIFDQQPEDWQLHVVPDGEQALAFLRRAGGYLYAPRPSLILLDINMPRVTGFEVLAGVKQDDHLRAIPVVMLTTSRAEADVIRSYQLHANAYVTKPADFESFRAAVRQIDDFFLMLAERVREP